ncbi:hypothetical protein T265_00662 [Opisthorchis viverrini]|uniref:acid phosphatase n=1 Tax=Opisthorchis viverrini TaxID=6198 RepID=A0A075AJK8_OPIVI|nr:hypothetical protein T265_00662 [Opisthorchis viverrini]KER33559.1 hypothetical protein T265_00662 [Opisthorchis viverrini]
MFPENPTPVGRLRVGWKICDPVGVWVLHQLPWPHWLTSEIAQQCARMLDFKHYIRFSTPALTRLRGGPLVAHMLRLFRTRANLELSRSSSAEQKKLAKPLPLVAPTSGLEVVGSGQRLIAYFAHDSTLAAVLSHLGIFNRMLDFKHYIRFSTPALTRLRGGPLVAHMLRLFRTRANLELSRSSSAEQKKLAKPLPLVAPTSGLEVVGSGQRLIAYFAHDSTLAAVLSHLGIFNRLKPPVASSLIVELHQNPTAADDFLVRFRYRNHTRPNDTFVYSLWPPACGPSQLAQESGFMCSLAQLESAMTGTYLVELDAGCEEAIREDLDVMANFYYPLLLSLLFANLLLFLYLWRRARLLNPEC